MNPAIVLGVAVALGGLGIAVAKAKDRTRPDDEPEPEEDDSANKEVNVRKMQELINKLIGSLQKLAASLGRETGFRMITVDGKFGPNTAEAWAAQAARVNMPPIAMGSLGATTARVNDRTAMALSEAAARIVSDKPEPSPKPKRDPAPKPPQPAPKPKPKPAGDDPLRNDLEDAREAAEKAKRLEDGGKPAPKPDTKPKPAPKPKPATAPTQKVTVRRVQEILRPLNPVTVDGKYGPNTETAYKAEAQRRGLASNIEKVKDEKDKSRKLVQVALVDKAALAALVDASVKAERAANKPAPAPGPAPKQARHELINNAINALDFATPPTPTGTRKSVNDLAEHWQKEYWQKGYRAEYPGKLDNYAAWYTRAWRMVTPAVQQNVPHPKTIDPKYVETPKPTPSAGAEFATIPVLRAQELVNRHGAGVKADGLFGQITRGAWQKLATQHKVSSHFERIDGKHVKVDAEALRKLEALPASSKAAPPPGYDRAKAKARARDVSAHLRKQGRAYDHALLKSWQTQAGIDADGLYGPHSRNALVYYGATDAPAPFSKGTEKPYVPPA